MLSDRQRLAEEIERLEKELDSQHFRVLFDRKAQQKQQKRLKKLRRELAELEGTAVISQPARRAEPKPVPKPRVPKATAPPLPPARLTAKSRESTADARPGRPTTGKSPAKPARKPSPAAKKPSLRTPKSPSKKPSRPAPKPRKKSR